MLSLKTASQKLLAENLAVKKDEKVTVVTDRKSCPIFNAVCSAAISRGAALTKVRISSRRTHSSPIPTLNDTFKKSDVIIAITDKSISHSPETRRARKLRGARVISMVEVNKALFLKAMSADAQRIRRIGDKLAEKLRRSKTVTITTPNGAYFTVETERKAISVDDGDSTKKGTINNIPYGEVTMAPIEMAEGTVAIDFARNHLKPKDNGKVFVKHGMIIGCTNSAKSFVGYLKKTDGNRALKVVELGLGINPGHKTLIYNVIHDEKIFGSVHIAFGGLGDKRKCKIHEDVILLKPTVYFDNHVVIRNGVIL